MPCLADQVGHYWILAHGCRGFTGIQCFLPCCCPASCPLFASELWLFLCAHVLTGVALPEFGTCAVSAIRNPLGGLYLHVSQFACTQPMFCAVLVPLPAGGVLPSLGASTHLKLLCQPAVPNGTPVSPVCLHPTYVCCAVLCPYACRC